MKKEFPRVLEVGRVADNPKDVLVSLAKPPTEDELRALLDYLQGDATEAPPQPAIGGLCG